MARFDQHRSMPGRLRRGGITLIGIGGFLAVLGVAFLINAFFEQAACIHTASLAARPWHAAHSQGERRGTPNRTRVTILTDTPVPADISGDSTPVSRWKLLIKLRLLRYSTDGIRRQRFPLVYRSGAVALSGATQRRL